MASNANAYTANVVKPTTPSPNNGTKAMHATVSTATGASIIRQTAENRQAHNALVLNGSGFKVQGGSKSKRSSSKRSKRSKSKRYSSKRSKRSKSKSKSNRYKHKRGGAPTPTPSSTPNPTASVPQFPGPHNVSANANSVSINHGLMKTGAQAVYDDPNAPASNTKL